jgi:amino acid transporter
MAALYPAAGSAYTYVGRALNPLAGFLAGWAMFLGYLALPLINVIYVAVAIQREFPWVPYTVGAAAYAGLITLLNLCGIGWTARSNQILLAAMSVVVGFFILLAIRYVLHLAGIAGLFSFQPFYNPATFDVHRMATAISFAALTYIGFDGLTTLAEDVDNPRRNILLAIILVVVITAAIGGFEVYLGQLVWPAYHFTQPETAFMDVCRRVGGMLLYHAMWVILILACIGSGLTGQVGAARIVFGMGRERVLPQKMFAHLNAKRNTPDFSITLIGVIAFLGGLVLNRGGRGFELGAEILNSGALVAFMAVDLAAFWKFYVRSQPGRQKRLWSDAVAPLAGLLCCLLIWMGLPRLVMAIGGSWLLLGLLIEAAKTKGFKTQPVMIDFAD